MRRRTIRENYRPSRRNLNEQYDRDRLVNTMSDLLIIIDNFNETVSDMKKDYIKFCNSGDAGNDHRGKLDIKELYSLSFDISEVLGNIYIYD